MQHLSATGPGGGRWRVAAGWVGGWGCFSMQLKLSEYLSESVTSAVLCTLPAQQLKRIAAVSLGQN
ncbi:MAG: hypothetical protein MJE68_00615 [Proteobacteria bacterium]|nr:hypothetical protein [Pseudomonadota bacterium]